MFEHFRATLTGIKVTKGANIDASIQDFDIMEFDLRSKYYNLLVGFDTSLTSKVIKDMYDLAFHSEDMFPSSSKSDGPVISQNSGLGSFKNVAADRRPPAMRFKVYETEDVGHSDDCSYGSRSTTPLNETKPMVDIALGSLLVVLQATTLENIEGLLRQILPPKKSAAYPRDTRTKVDVYRDLEEPHDRSAPLELKLNSDLLRLWILDEQVGPDLRYAVLDMLKFSVSSGGSFNRNDSTVKGNWVIEMQDFGAGLFRRGTFQPIMWGQPSLIDYILREPSQEGTSVDIQALFRRITEAEADSDSDEAAPAFMKSWFDIGDKTKESNNPKRASCQSKKEMIWFRGSAIRSSKSFLSLNFKALDIRAFKNEWDSFQRILAAVSFMTEGTKDEVRSALSFQISILEFSISLQVNEDKGIRQLCSSNLNVFGVSNYDSKVRKYTFQQRQYLTVLSSLYRFSRLAARRLDLETPR